MSWREALQWIVAPGVAVLALLSFVAVVAFAGPRAPVPAPAPAEPVRVVVVEPDLSRTAARECMALVAFTEARGEGVAGMAAVLETVRTRQLDRRWPASACAVVLQRSQFHGVRGWHAERAASVDPASWTIALALADAALDGAVLVPRACRGATHFDRGGGWPGMIPRCKVGSHAFYFEPS